MSKLKHLIAATALVAIFIPLPVSANVYLGGYFTGSTYDTGHVICMSNPCSIPAGTIPSGNMLGGVMSVAGVKGGNPSGWIYQLATHRRGSDNALCWNTQSWDMGVIKNVYERALSYKEPAWAAVYLRMDMMSNYVRSRCWGYETSNDLNNDTWTHYDYHYLTKNYGEDWFRVGTATVGSYLFKHSQFGVESVNKITNYNWTFTEKQIGYFNVTDFKWKYKPAKVTYQGTSYITYRSGYIARIGDSNYTGVNKDSSSSDYIKWKYTGSTIGNDITLWSGSGNVSTTPATPFTM